MQIEQANRSVCEASTERGRLLVLALMSLCAGVVTGLLAAAFRLALSHAEQMREAMLGWSHGHGVVGFLVTIGLCAVATGVAAWLVRRFSPHATGSGIPHIEAQLAGNWSGSPLRIILVKFVGGLLAIGAGLALGREGPTVQMGGSLALLLGRIARRTEAECKALLAAGAGAGLATAFNAPIAGAVFVLEELVRRFDVPITIAALGASAGAIGIARYFLGQAPDFHVALLPYPGPLTLPVHLLFGIGIGLLGVAYNRAIIGALGVADRLGRRSPAPAAAAIGVMVGVLAWFVPALAGPGDTITQQLLGGTGKVLGYDIVTSAFAFIFVIRFALGAVSYAARTPGGLFAPLLVVGSQSGLLFGTLCAQWFPGAGINPITFVVVGMAALFTSVVRAPVTGIILAIELTGSFTLLLPMLAACFAAMVVPKLLKEPPIYESLRWGRNDPAAARPATRSSPEPPAGASLRHSPGNVRVATTEATPSADSY
jgi:CIC family chloride channel protein